MSLVVVYTMEPSQPQEPPAPTSLPPQEDPASHDALSETPPIEDSLTDPLTPPPSSQSSQMNENPGGPDSVSENQEGSSEFVPGSLEDFSVRSQRRRLSVEEEAQASELLRTTLLNGRAEVARAIQIIPTLPWMITAQGASSAWPELKPSFRSQLLAGLAKAEGDHAARVRLSLARALFKLDPAATLKLILLTLKVLRDKSTGLLVGKGAPAFSSVLIGRGKAWILQLPTGDLKPAELDLLVNAALHAAFHAPQAPISQISVLKWASQLGRLSERPPALDDLISKSLSKWSGKWQSILQREVDSLPESWTQAFKTASRSSPSSSEDSTFSESETSADSDSEAEAGSKGEPESENSSKRRPSRSRDRYDSRGRRPQSGAARTDTASPFPENEDENAVHGADEDEEHLEAKERENERESEHEESEGEEHPVRPSASGRPRPVYVSKTIPSHASSYPPSASSGSSQSVAASPGMARRGSSPAGFNLSETLRQIEQYAAGLRSELHAAQKQLRQRDEDRRTRRPERPQSIPGDPSLEELSRLNQQLESRNAELAARLEELSTDSEERAASRGLITDAPEPDPNTQLRSLLAFKLREDFEDFKALEEASKDLVVQQHYPSLLRHIFEVLQQEGVVFPPPERRPEA